MNKNSTKNVISRVFSALTIILISVNGYAEEPSDKMRLCIQEENTPMCAKAIIELTNPFFQILTLTACPHVQKWTIQKNIGVVMIAKRITGIIAGANFR